MTDSHLRWNCQWIKSPILTTMVPRGEWVCNTLIDLITSINECAVIWNILLVCFPREELVRPQGASANTSQPWQIRLAFFGGTQHQPWSPFSLYIPHMAARTLEESRKICRLGSSLPVRSASLLHVSSASRPHALYSMICGSFACKFLSRDASEYGDEAAAAVTPAYASTSCKRPTTWVHWSLKRIAVTPGAPL
jgi:hypothetical protein